MHMAKTLDDLQNLLTRAGYACELLLDAIVATRVPTKTYKNPAGDHTLEIYVTFDRPNKCVAVEVLHAFDLRKTDHREATLACVLTASGRTPLLRPALEPEGDIKIRIDCLCEADEAQDERVLEAVAVLTGFVEAWHPQVAAAMKTGKFNAHDVARFNLSRMPSRRPAKPKKSGETDKTGELDKPAKPNKPDDSAAPDEPATSEEPAATAEQAKTGRQARSRSIGSMMRAAAISAKPGGTPVRLAVLKAFREWLDDQRGRDGEQN
jgi:hypothetical protein